MWEATNDDSGRAGPVMIGLAPLTRAEMEYEFDLVAEFDDSHIFSVSNTRVRTLDRAVVKLTGPEFGNCQAL